MNNFGYPFPISVPHSPDSDTECLWIGPSAQCKSFTDQSEVWTEDSDRKRCIIREGGSSCTLNLQDVGVDVEGLWTIQVSRVIHSVPKTFEEASAKFRVHVSGGGRRRQQQQHGDGAQSPPRQDKALGGMEDWSN